MVNLGCLLVCTFGNLLAPILDFGDGQGHEKEGYKSEP